MKDKIHAFREKLQGSAAFRGAIWPVKWLWTFLSHNFGLKLLSLLMAILLWNYVVSSNTSITRPKVLTGLTGYVNGQSTLTSYGLAMLENPREELKNITVTVEVPQTNYSRVRPNNVQVTLDVSNVRTAGTQEVPLKAVSTYGRVEEISPKTLTVTFEALDSRSVPVNVAVESETSDAYWYNVSRINPTIITVSGAASKVRSISSASAVVDATGHEKAFTSAVPYTFMDAAGNEVSQDMLTRSSSSASVSVGVYPKKEMPVSTDLANVVSGVPAEGYQVADVSIQPETITIAAEGDLLDDLEMLMIEPVSVEGVSQSFSVRADVSALPDFKYVSAEQVYVNVTIAEENSSAWIEDVDVRFSGKGEGLSVTYRYDELRVLVSGPRSVVEEIKEEGLSASIDLSGLDAGDYELPIRFEQELYPDVIFQPEMDVLPITLTDMEANG